MNQDHPTTVATAVLVFALIVSPSMTAVDVATADGQEREPNDDFDTAGGLPEGETAGEITSGDSDFFEIRLNDTDALNVTEVGNNDQRGSGLNVNVYGPDRNTLASDRVVGGTRPVVVKATENGTHYVEVVGEDDSVNKNYTLLVDRVTPAENDAFAPNDDFDSAATLSEGFSDARIWGGESDFYRIDLNATDALDVEEVADNDGRGSGLDLNVYGPDREQLATDRVAGGTRQLVFKATENGTHYVEVVGEDDAVTKNYTLRAEKVTPSENDAFAPNDDFDSAAAITSEFSDAKVWGGESDYYRVGLNESEVVEVDASPGDANLNLRVYLPNRTLLREDRNFGGVASHTFAAPETGIYFVEVAGEETTTTVEYTLETNQTGVTTVEVGPVQRFNTDGGAITISELGNAAAAYVRGELTITELGQVAAAYVRS